MDEMEIGSNTDVVLEKDDAHTVNYQKKTN